MKEYKIILKSGREYLVSVIETEEDFFKNLFVNTASIFPFKNPKKYNKEDRVTIVASEVESIEFIG